MKRAVQKKRVTKETNINIFLDLESSAPSSIKTPIPFFTHMLEGFAKHGGFYLKCDIQGDVEVDLHHTVEDTGIVLGEVFKEALGEKIGITRFGSMFVPMDETLVRVVLDLSGRTFFLCNLDQISGKVMQFDMEHGVHFFRSFADHLKMNLHIELLYGRDKHHILEASFKALSRALAQAVEIKGDQLPSTKGVL